MLHGIDVSHHNGAIDWRAVASAGTAFAFLKASEGIRGVDRRFETNRTAAREAGILCGAYHFFRPSQPARAQADHFCSVVGDHLAPGELPPVLDLEETTPRDEWPAIARPDRLPRILEWLEAVETRLGRRPIIYTRRSWVASALGIPGALIWYPLWIAHYTRFPRPATPAGWNWAFWQYTDSGRLCGVTGKVDRNRFFGSLEELRQLACAAGAPETARA